MQTSWAIPDAVMERNSVHKSVRWRPKTLSGLLYASCLFSLGTIATIIALFAAGTQRPHTGATGEDGVVLNSVDLSIISFDGITVNRNQTYPYLARHYWFLSTLAWYQPYDDEEINMGYVYVQPGRTLSFPGAIHDLLQSLNTTGDLSYCIHPSVASPCYAVVRPGFVEAFDAAPLLSLPTAPSFVFYLITLAGSFVTMVLGLARSCGPKLSTARWEHTRFMIPHVTTVTHLIAAGAITGESVRLMSYLNRFQELMISPSYGGQFFVVVWLGVGFTILTALFEWTRVVLERR